MCRHIRSEHNPLCISCRRLHGGPPLTRGVVCEVDEANILSYIFPSIQGVEQRVLLRCAAPARADKYRTLKVALLHLQQCQAIIKMMQCSCYNQIHYCVACSHSAHRERYLRYTLLQTTASVGFFCFFQPLADCSVEWGLTHLGA